MSHAASLPARETTAPGSTQPPPRPALDALPLRPLPVAGPQGRVVDFVIYSRETRPAAGNRTSEKTPQREQSQAAALARPDGIINLELASGGEAVRRGWQRCLRNVRPTQPRASSRPRCSGKGEHLAVHAGAPVASAEGDGCESSSRRETRRAWPTVRGAASACSRWAESGRSATWSRKSANPASLTSGAPRGELLHQRRIGGVSLEGAAPQTRATCRPSALVRATGSWTGPSLLGRALCPPKVMALVAWQGAVKGGPRPPKRTLDGPGHRRADH